MDLEPLVHVLSVDERVLPKYFTKNTPNQILVRDHLFEDTIYVIASCEKISHSNSRHVYHGTAFYVGGGMFCTAGHVCQLTEPPQDGQSFVLYAIQAPPDGGEIDINELVEGAVPGCFEVHPVAYLNPQAKKTPDGILRADSPYDPALDVCLLIIDESGVSIPPASTAVLPGLPTSAEVAISFFGINGTDKPNKKEMDHYNNAFTRKKYEEALEYMLPNRLSTIDGKAHFARMPLYLTRESQQVEEIAAKEELHLLSEKKYFGVEETYSVTVTNQREADSPDDEVRLSEADVSASVESENANENSGQKNEPSLEKYYIRGSQGAGEGILSNLSISDNLRLLCGIETPASWKRDKTKSLDYTKSLSGPVLAYDINTFGGASGSLITCKIANKRRDRGLADPWRDMVFLDISAKIKAKPKDLAQLLQDLKPDSGSKYSLMDEPALMHKARQIIFGRKTDLKQKQTESERENIKAMSNLLIERFSQPGRLLAIHIAWHMDSDANYVLKCERYPKSANIGVNINTATFRKFVRDHVLPRLVDYSALKEEWICWLCFGIGLK